MFVDARNEACANQGSACFIIRLFSLVFRLRIQTWLRIQTGGAGIAHFEAGTSGQKMTNFMLQNGCDDVTIL
jgi:hypothetical protein